MSFRALLFDIDGTLISCGGAGRRSLERAMERHLGDAVTPEETWLSGLKLDGMTDRLIVREAMVALGIEFDEALCDRILASYVEALREEIGGPGYRVLPGVERVLGQVADARVLLGLCTGNVASGARVKLGRGAVDRFFGWSAAAPNGFAEDGEARERIVAAVLRRCAQLTGDAFTAQDAVVIGDTPRDITAARAHGVPVLAVATGRFSVEQLAREGAELVVESLEDPAALRFLLG
ncbi:MAG TPA: HAD family hydrolase [Anaeromyxobacteraceae bacterium]|nr:HAD family hydrolase [Anaeromyxobacteraceae bacterium]